MRTAEVNETPWRVAVPHKSAIAVMGESVQAIRTLPNYQRLQHLEADAARACQVEMTALREQHPVWFFEFEDADPDTADLKSVMDLLLSAPNAFAKGVIFGKFSLRMQIAAMTGCEA